MRFDLRRVQNGLGWLALLALLLTPLVFDPGAHDDAYITPKWCWIAIWSGLGAATLLSRFCSGRPVMFPFDEVWIAALAFCAWNWISVAWAASPSLARDRAWHITWLTLALWLGIHLLRERGLLIRAGRALVALGCVTAAWVLVEDFVRVFAPAHTWIRPNLSDWRGFLAAGLGNTNHIGDFLALAFLPCLMFFGETRRRFGLLGYGFAAALLAAALIVCYSVGSNLGLIAGSLLMAGLVLGMIGPRWFLRRWPRWLALLVAWGVVIAWLNIDVPFNPHRPGILQEGFGSTRWHEGGPTRLAIWAQSLEMIRLHPLLGVGAGNFTYVFPEMDSGLIADRPDLLAYQGMWTNAAHNEILQTWCELGIVGLFILILVASTAGYHLLRRINQADAVGLRLRIALAGLLAAWLAQAQMNFTFVHPAGTLSFYALLLAIIAEKRTRPRAGGAMPALRNETDWFALQVDWHSMNKPTGIGLAALLPSAAAASALVVLLAGWGWFAFGQLAPLRAQRAYAAGVSAERAGNAAAADAAFQRALAIDPQAHDARSHYSEWLVKQRRPQQALEQLARVRERLNSYELFVREAAARDQLGQTTEAERAFNTGVGRVWRLRQQYGVTSAPPAPTPHP